MTATSSCLRVTLLTNCEFGILRKHDITAIIIMLPNGEIKAIQRSPKARLLASVLKSGTTRGSFVLLKNTAHINHSMTTVHINSVHLMCLGLSILVTLIKLSIKLPFMTRYLSLNSYEFLSFFLSLNTSFMLLKSSSSVE
jgi:hypothetical protein